MTCVSYLCFVHECPSADVCAYTCACWTRVCACVCWTRVCATLDPAQSHRHVLLWCPCGGARHTYLNACMRLQEGAQQANVLDVLAEHEGRKEKELLGCIVLGCRDNQVYCLRITVAASTSTADESEQSPRPNIQHQSD